MQLHEEFEWDDEKAAENLQRHAISFFDAAEILSVPDGDRWHLEFIDDRVDYNAIRWLTLAPDSVNPARLVAIVWTERQHSRAKHYADYLGQTSHRT